MLRLIAQKLLKLQASSLQPQTFYYKLSALGYELSLYFDNRFQAAFAFAALLSPLGSAFPVAGGVVPRKRAIRSSRGGWVENKLISQIGRASCRERV